jgi:hypothetical protein
MVSPSKIELPASPKKHEYAVAFGEAGNAILNKNRRTINATEQAVEIL